MKKISLFSTLLLLSACMSTTPSSPTVPLLNGALQLELPDGWTVTEENDEGYATYLTLKQTTENYEIEATLSVAPENGGMPIPTDPEDYTLVTETAHVSQHACSAENPPDSESTACYILHLASDDWSTFYVAHFYDLKTLSPVWDSSIPEPWTPPIEILQSEFEALLGTAHNKTQGEEGASR